MAQLQNKLIFRQGPGREYEIISSLKPGTQVFILSTESQDDFYNIIDIKTDEEGFVHKSYVKIGRLIAKSDGGFIQ